MKAIVLLSGGLDSYTAAAIAKADGFELYALTVSYGQRHARELDAARRVAARARRRRAISSSPSISAPSADRRSRRTSTSRAIATSTAASDIPSTYVPARNTIFLSLALGWAEVVDARDIVIGVNALDYSGYPDCRPEFIRAFEALAALATRAGVEGARDPRAHAAHRALEGRHHPARPRARPRLRPDPQLLRSGGDGDAVRALRQLPASREGLCRSRGRGSASTLESTHRCGFFIPSPSGARSSLPPRSSCCRSSRPWSGPRS